MFSQQQKLNPSATCIFKCLVELFCIQPPVELDRAELELLNTSSQSFPPPPVLSAVDQHPQSVITPTAGVDQRPHTISSAYERSAHARPSLGADTFTPPTALLPGAVPTASRSRPPSVHGSLPAAESVSPR